MDKCLERKLLYHFLSDSVKIVHLFCTNCVISHTFPLQCVAFVGFLPLFLPILLHIVAKIIRAKWNIQTNKKTNCTCNICASSLYAQRIAFHLDSASLCADVFTGAGACVACCCVHFSFDSFVQFCLYFSSS